MQSADEVREDGPEESRLMRLGIIAARLVLFPIWAVGVAVWGGVVAAAALVQVLRRAWRKGPGAPRRPHEPRPMGLGVVGRQGARTHRAGLVATRPDRA
jgi:hypothetical protein